MSDQDRIKRAIKGAEECLLSLKNTWNPFEQQASWENFLLHWKRAIELLGSYCSKTCKDEIKERRHAERDKDISLKYAWAARNAEEHDSQGSADAYEGSVKINPLNRYKPLKLHNVVMGSDGRFEKLDMENGVICVDGGRLTMRPLTTRNGKSVIEPPSVSPLDVCVMAMRHLEEFYREIF